MKKIQLTNAHKEKLFQIPLFRDLPLNIKESLLDKLDFVIYAADKKEIVCCKVHLATNYMCYWKENYARISLTDWGTK